MIQGTSAVDRPVEKVGNQRRLLLYGLPALVVLAGLVWYGPTAARWFSTERTVDRGRVRIATVTRGDLERDLSVQGRVVAALHPTAFSPARGIIALRVRAGEVVEQGQVLAVLDSPELRSRLQQERSTHQSLQADMERRKIEVKQKVLGTRQSIDLAGVAADAARRAMDRAEQSRREGIINDVEFELAEDELRRSRLELAHARQDAELEKETLDFEVRNSELAVERQRLAVVELQRQVAELQIRSPVAGLVSRLDVDDHDSVTPGQPLIGVVDLSAFEIEVMIPESYVDDVGPGTLASLRQGTELFPGEVRSVSPEVENGQVRGIVTFVDRMPDGLRQNQRVSTRLILESRQGVLKVQRGPFLEAGGGRSAYVVRKDTAMLEEIRVGATSVGEVEIVAGLEAGDQIIISDTTRYRNAERLFLRE